MDGQIAVLAVAEKGSFEAAGKYLGIGKSAVRKRVRSVESELGTPVVRAAGGGMVPTDAGNIYLPVARESVRQASLGVDRVRAFVRVQTNDLRIGYLGEPYRTMVLVAQCLGLRVSEILGLQWGDFNFENRSVLVQRSVVGGRVDYVKTEYSRDDVPLDARLAEVLLQGRSASVFPRNEDWLFANPVTGRPYHQESLQKSQIKRAAKLAKLGEDLGWHTFRHTYRSWLDETGAPMKVQQELMRHASIQTTMNVYGRAMTETKRQANSQVVGLVFGPNSQNSATSEASATLQ
jgi:integrase